LGVRLAQPRPARHQLDEIAPIRLRDVGTRKNRPRKNDSRLATLGGTAIGTFARTRRNEATSRRPTWSGTEQHIGEIILRGRLGTRRTGLGGALRSAGGNPAGEECRCSAESRRTKHSRASPSQEAMGRVPEKDLLTVQTSPFRSQAAGDIAP